MPLYPLFADLDQREVLVVGGGEVATRKVEALLHAGARVLVCAPVLSPQLAQWLADGRVHLLPGPFEPAWLDAAWLVVAATDDGPFNARLADEAQARKKLVNVVDDAALSTFQAPVIVDRDPVLIAISSSGAAPMLARRLGRQLETQLDAAWGSLAALFARHRDAIRLRFADLAARRDWYDAHIEGDVMALLRAGEAAAAEQALLASLQATAPSPARGGLALVVLPEGDPGQLTLHALRAMSRADHVVVHRGFDHGVAVLARRDATREVVEAFDAPVAGALAERARAGRQAVILWPDASPQAAMAKAAADMPVERLDCTGQRHPASPG